jgi:glycosyltransferase involved in cell wall biosynthesis
VPLLSIIIPVYNAEQTITATLSSLRQLSNESRQYTEVIIVNDGSQDRSMDIVNSMLLFLSPIKVIIVDQKNEGAACARNAGIDLSSGTYIFFLDADDELAFDPIPVLHQQRNASALAFSVRYYRGTTPIRFKHPRPINKLNHLDVFTASNVLTVSSIIFRRDLITCVFDPSFRNLEDWLFWILNPGIFDNMQLLPEVTSAYIHIHGNNMSSDLNKMGMYREAVEMIENKYGLLLTVKQRNNLSIQSAIGSILQGKFPPLKYFFLFPCNTMLYFKFLVYAVFRNNLTRINIYRKSS